MSSAVIDPSLFRLRLFEREWLGPLENTIAALSAASSSAEPDAASRRDLAIALLDEAQRWRHLGSQLGYFAATSDGGTRAEIDTTPQLTTVRRRIHSASGTGLVVPLCEFATALDDAQDDLTPDRREYLRLLFFSTEDEWDARLGEARGFARRVTASSAVPSDAIDATAWSLDGAESDLLLTVPSLPCEWRVDTSWAEEDELLRERLNELATVRHTVAIAVTEAFDLPSVGIQIPSIDLQLPRLSEVPDVRSSVLLARAHRQLADLRLETGDYDAAAGELAAAVAAQERALDAEPNNRRVRRGLALALSQLGDLLRSAGALDEAAAAYARADRLLAGLLQEEPNDHVAMRDVALTHTRRGDLSAAYGDHNAAVRGFHAARAIEEALLRMAPGDPTAVRDLGITHIRLGDSYVAMREHSRALAHFSNAIDLLDTFVAREPLDEEFARLLSGVHIRAADVYSETGERELAAEQLLAAQRRLHRFG